MLYLWFFLGLTLAAQDGTTMLILHLVSCFLMLVLQEPYCWFCEAVKRSESWTYFFGLVGLIIWLVFMALILNPNN